MYFSTPLPPYCWHLITVLHFTKPLNGISTIKSLFRLKGELRLLRRGWLQPKGRKQWWQPRILQQRRIHLSRQKGEGADRLRTSSYRLIYTRQLSHFDVLIRVTPHYDLMWPKILNLKHLKLNIILILPKRRLKHGMEEIWILSRLCWSGV